VDADAVGSAVASAAAREAHPRDLCACLLERAPYVLQGVQLASRGVKSRGVGPRGRPAARGEARLARDGLAGRARSLPPASGGVQRQCRGRFASCQGAALAASPRRRPAAWTALR
jgi:hypothetical protein